MTNDPLIGKKLANFQIERLLAHGGMADVYYGVDVNLQRPVAIKVIDARFRKNPSYAQRFISEARSMAAWRHENLVQVYYADQQDDLYYFVMEYIDGVSLDVLLREYAEKGEFMPYDEVIHIGNGVAQALNYAHKRGVIHRDIKPPNIMISKENRVVLMDFGLALDTQQGSIGEVFGTPHYIAPEQARRSADATALSDVYSLGVMLYEMLTGTVPFDDPSATSVAILHLSEAPPLPRLINPELSEAVEMVLLRVLEKEPQHRYASTIELMKELESALKAPKAPAPESKLPPLPAGVVPPEAPDRKLWDDSLSERVSNLTRNPAAMSPMPTSPTKPRPSMMALPLRQPVQRKRRGWVWPVVIVGILLLGIFSVFLMSYVGTANLRADAERTSTANTLVAVINVQTTQTALSVTETALAASHTPTMTDTATDAPPTLTVTDSPTLTQTSAPTTDVPVLIPTDVVISATATETQTETDVPPTLTETTTPPTLTETQTPRPTRTPIRLLTNTPEPTETHTPTHTPTATLTLTPSPTSLTPTVLYPDGNPIQMTWNSKSFYVFNPNDFSIVVEPLAFEALTSDGTPLPYRLEGDRWILGFPVIESRKCSAVEMLLETELLQPDWCNGYNAVLTLVPDDSENFWVRRDGATQFRVLWAGDEIARCRISANVCEVNLP